MSPSTDEKQPETYRLCHAHVSCRLFMPRKGCEPHSELSEYTDIVQVRMCGSGLALGPYALPWISFPSNIAISHCSAKTRRERVFLSHRLMFLYTCLGQIHPLVYKLPPVKIFLEFVEVLKVLHDFKMKNGFPNTHCLYNRMNYERL